MQAPDSRTGTPARPTPATTAGEDGGLSEHHRGLAIRAFEIAGGPYRAQLTRALYDLEPGLNPAEVEAIIQVCFRLRRLGDVQAAKPAEPTQPPPEKEIAMPARSSTPAPNGKQPPSASWGRRGPLNKLERATVRQVIAKILDSWGNDTSLAAGHRFFTQECQIKLSFDSYKKHHLAELERRAVGTVLSAHTRDIVPEEHPAVIDTADLAVPRKPAAPLQGGTPPAPPLQGTHAATALGEFHMVPNGDGTFDVAIRYRSVERKMAVYLQGQSMSALYPDV